MFQSALQSFKISNKFHKIDFTLKMSKLITSQVFDSSGLNSNFCCFFFLSTCSWSQLLHWGRINNEIEWIWLSIEMTNILVTWPSAVMGSIMGIFLIQRDRTRGALLQHQNFNFLFCLGWSGCFTQSKHIIKVVQSWNIYFQK